MGYKLVLGGLGSDILRYDNHNTSVQVLLPFTLRNADHFIGSSQALIDKAIELAPTLRGATSVIPKGVNPDFFSVSATPTGSRSPLLVCVGNLRTVKGHDILIRALPSILKTFPDLELKIAGEGPERQNLQALTTKLGVDDHVTFMGWSTQAEIQDLLASATLFVMPSRSEGFGLALVEAMAAGLPVVASNVGGMKDIVEHKKSGVLVPAKSPKALADAVLEVLCSDEYATRLAQNARRRARDYSWERTIDQYESVFQHVMER